MKNRPGTGGFSVVTSTFTTSDEDNTAAAPPQPPSKAESLAWSAYVEAINAHDLIGSLASQQARSLAYQTWFATFCALTGAST